VTLCLIATLIPVTNTATVAATTRETAMIAAGGNNSFVIKADGSLWGWGYNIGDLGDGTEERRLSPIKMMDSVKSVSAGATHNMAIKTDSSLWAWGENVHGELGDGTTTPRLFPVKIMDSVVSVSVGGNHALAIKADGSLWAWGWNINGELGDGTTTTRTSPVKIMDSVVSVSAGGFHTMAIKADGSLWAWGSNIQGRLGDGTTTDCHSPIKVMDSVVSVSAGARHTTAVKADGSLWAWGLNSVGQLGDGTQIDRHSPIKVMDSVISVSAGNQHTLAIKADGSLWVWGGGEAVLGDGTGTDEQRLSPVKIMDSVASVSAGFQVSMAVREDGSLWNWGAMAGDGTEGWHFSPVRIMNDVMLPGAEPVSPSSLAPAGQISSWAAEQVGAAIAANLVPQPFQTNYTFATTRIEFAALAVRLYETVTGGVIVTGANPFLDTDYIDAVKAAGIGVTTGTGDGTTFSPNALLTREQAATMLSRLANAIGRPLTNHTATFADSGDISSWAADAVGRMQTSGIMGGVGNNLFSPGGPYTREQSIVTIVRLYDILTANPTPSREPEMTTGNTFASVISAGDFVSMAIKSDNSLWTWGTNTYGRLGVDHELVWDSPEPMKMMGDVMSVDMGHDFSIAAKMDGSLWAWGCLGKFGLDEVSLPVKIMDDVVFAAAGSDDIVFIKTDGSLWLWGDTVTLFRLYDFFHRSDDHDLVNFDDMRKYADEISRGEPLKIMEDVVFASVAESIYKGSVLAIKTDGSLWRWSTYFNEDNKKMEQDSRNIFGLKDVASVSYTGNLAMAVKKDGSLWAWGTNYRGEIGNGTKERIWSPVQIMKDVAFVSIGSTHILAVKNDGSLGAWGENEYGQLGNGKITTHKENNDQLRPIKIMDDVVYISAGSKHSLAVKNDGSLWSWGDKYASPWSIEAGGEVIDSGGVDEKMSKPVKIIDNIRLVE